MFEETEELPDWPESTQRYRMKCVPADWIEMLPVLTCASQSDTCSLRFWHWVAFWAAKTCSESLRDSLDPRFRRRKLASLLLVLKSGRLVRAIAKRFISRVSAAAESDCCASGKAIGLTLHVNELDFPFDAQRPIITNYNFG
jgi:hypothetical protein